MKQPFLIFLLLALTLASCSGNTGSASGTNPEAQFDPNSRELPLATKLAIGTLKLEGTELAVASDQAAKLLPLWQVLNKLSSSDSAAPEEVTAITEQIQETMSAEQLQAIEGMEITPADMFASMQELGLIDESRVNASGTPQPGAGFGGEQGPGGGFVPGNGPPDGGPGGGFGGQGLSPEQIATAQARRAEGGAAFGNRMLSPLVEAVIELLESRAQ